MTKANLHVYVRMAFPLVPLWVYQEAKALCTYRYYIMEDERPEPLTLEHHMYHLGKFLRGLARGSRPLRHRKLLDPR